jgi:hypothetical protein
VLVVPIAGIRMKQRLAVTTSTLTELGLHATRRHVRAPEENGKSLVLPNHPGQLPRLKKEEEIYAKLWKKTHPEEQPPSPRRFPATFRSLLPEIDLVAISFMCGRLMS